MYQQQPKSTWKIVLIIILALLVLAEGYFIYKYYSSWKNEKNSKQSVSKELEDCQKELKSCQKGTSTIKEEETSPSQTSTCESTLTDADKTEIEGWKTVKNDTQKYSFKYPKTWQVTTEEKDYVVLKDDSEGADINFQFRSDLMTGTDIDPSFTKTDSKSVKVDCLEATETFFSSDDNRLILVSFKKDDIPHIIIFAYKDIGVSMSGDILDAFNLILESISFS